RDSYLKRIEGLVVGEDPRQGFVESNTFYHPVLKFQFPTPAGWGVLNTPQQVQMTPSDGSALMMLMLAGKGSLEDAANGLLQQYNLTLVESKKENINGLNSILLVADQKQEQGTIRLVAALIQHDGIVYNLMGISSL